MNNKLQKFAVVILALAYAFIPSAGAETLQQKRMQKHVDKVKITHPKEYQDMVDKSNGIISDCLSCHKDMNRKKDSSSFMPKYPK